MILHALLVAAESSEEARNAMMCLQCTVLSVFMLAVCTVHESGGCSH